MFEDNTGSPWVKETLAWWNKYIALSPFCICYYATPLDKSLDFTPTLERRIQQAVNSHNR